MFDSKWFFTRFSDQVSQIPMDVYKHDATGFTKQVTAVVNEIIKKMDCLVQNEYYRIDASGWTDKKQSIQVEANLVGLNAHLWDLQIAVEHENDVRDWTDELIKLVHIRCPLKVLIGYNYCDQRGALEQQRLACAAAWMQQVKAFDAHAQEEYLIILGNAAARDANCDYKSFDYRGYLFDYSKNEFVRLSN